MSAIEAQDVMAEFEEVVANEDIVDVESMIESLNEDQRRVFDRVSTASPAFFNNTKSSTTTTYVC